MIFDEILSDAASAYPNEACGLVVRSASGLRVVPAKNLSPVPREHSVMDPRVWRQVAEGETVVATYHSHPDGVAQASPVDLVECDRSEVSMLIVGYPRGDLVRIEPTGSSRGIPYAGRPYRYGVLDCFTLIQDWYQRERQHLINRVDAPEGWWDRGESVFVDHVEKSGFRPLVVGEDPAYGDLILFQVQSRVPNHLGIHLGSQAFLHQPRNRLSTVDTYSGPWERMTYNTYRLK